jgi:hypothetical protein
LILKVDAQAKAIAEPTHSFEGLLESARDLIDLFNEKELTVAIKGGLTTGEY